MEKLIKLKDFATQRGITLNSLTQWIYRARKKAGDDWTDLPTLDGVQALEIDSPLWKKLDKRYPMPTNPVEVVENAEKEKLREELIDAQKKTIAAQDEIQRLQREIFKLQGQIAEGNTAKVLLEEVQNTQKEAVKARDIAIEDRNRETERAAAAEEARKQAEKDAEDAKNRAEAAEKKVEEMRNAGIWRRIRNRW